MAPVRRFAAIIQWLRRIPAARIGAFAAIGLAVMLPAPAAATGTLFCTIDDRNVSFELLGSTRSDYGTIVQVQKGSLKLKRGRYVKQATAFDVAEDNIILQWSFDRDLRFAVHVDDPDRNGSIFLAIIAVRNERLDKYLGRYVLQFVGAHAPKVVKGRIKSCEGE
jgi:hypothetical protein